MLSALQVLCHLALPHMTSVKLLRYMLADGEGGAVLGVEPDSLSTLPTCCGSTHTTPGGRWPAPSVVT